MRLWPGRPLLLRGIWIALWTTRLPVLWGILTLLPLQLAFGPLSSEILHAGASPRKDDQQIVLVAALNYEKQPGLVFSTLAYDLVGRQERVA